MVFQIQKRNKNSHGTSSIVCKNHQILNLFLFKTTSRCVLREYLDLEILVPSRWTTNKLYHKICAHNLNMTVCFVFLTESYKSEEVVHAARE